MSQIIVKINSKTTVWTQNMRYRVGQPTTHDGQNWINLTGANTEPGIGPDWKSISSIAGASTKEEFIAAPAQTNFVLTSTPGNVDVYVDRVYQLNIIDYALVGDTVEMVDALDVGSKVEIRKF